MWREGKRDYMDYVFPQSLRSVGCTPALVSLIQDGNWTQSITPSYRRQAEEWLDIVKRHGPELATEPVVKLGTIHASKGAEADVVILSTETSKAIELGRRRSEQIHDDECRVAYVAVTRAKKKLVVVEDGRRHRMSLPI